MKPTRIQITSTVFIAALSLALTAMASVYQEEGNSNSVLAATMRSTDIGLKSGFQDYYLDHFQRGRATIAADFDLDGRVDFFMGNPGDESMILRNVTRSGKAKFKIVQVLFSGELAFGGVAFDYDNDGDYDLFVTMGGIEGVGFNHLLKNLWIESGRRNLSFEDVTDIAGVSGPIPPGEETPIPVASFNAVVADYDRDGWDDIFVNVAIIPSSLDEIKGRNILWHNNGDGTFSDVTDQVGLTTMRDTYVSTFFDMDNDGDMDLYETNYGEDNVLWQNRAVEDGVAWFKDVTQLYSPPGENLACPTDSFDSVAADFDNDGWEDLLVLTRLNGDQSAFGNSPVTVCPYSVGHVLFHNLGGTGFANVADSSGINTAFPTTRGVMGAQVGDVTGDGVPDVYIGNGAPEGGNNDQFFVADSMVGAPIHFADQSVLIDFPAPQLPDVTYPPYPYHTHGTAFADVDNDGTLEIAVSSGGPAALPDTVREPDRLFKIAQKVPPHWLKLRPVGNAVTVAKDAVGTRFALTVSQGAGTPWTIYRTLFAGSCFPAQNGFDVHFGLGNADTIKKLVITWPDGTSQTITSGLTVNTGMIVQQP